MEKPTLRPDIFNIKRIRALYKFGSKLSIENIRLMLVIFDVVAGGLRAEGRPEYSRTILSMRDRYNQLQDQVAHRGVGYDDAILITIANKFEKLAAEICSFEGLLLRI
jgi:hypothetical protein